MDDPRVARLFEAARRGRLSRRQLLSIGGRLGLASPVITALLAAAPKVGAAPSPTTVVPRRAQEGGSTFTVVIFGGTDTLDPQYAYSNIASMHFFGCYEMLIQYRGESTSEYEPMLAESWEANADGSVYTFKLRPNTLFHDGTTCDAQAVKDSFVRFHRMAATVSNVITRFVDEPEQQIEVVDPVTVRFNLGAPQPLFLAAMASEYGPFVISPTAVNEHKSDDDPWAHEWLTLNTVGTGPYMLTEYEPSERAVLTKFPDYHRGWDGNHFDQIVVRVVAETATRRQLLERGEADTTTFYLSPEDIEAMQTNPDLQVLIYDSTNVEWIIMNVPRLKTKEVRQGFSYAFPYDEVINGAYKGLAKRSGPLPDTVRGYDPNVFLYQTDLTRAKELILSGDFQEGDTFEYLIASGRELDRTVAQLFQANVEQMGFQLEITEVESAAQLDLVYGDTPAEETPHFVGAWGWWPDYNDPWNQFAPSFLESSITGGGANGGHWVNARFEEIMAEAEHYTDEARLNELMKEAQNILTELDPPMIYQGQAKWYTILRKDIQGFVPNPLYLGSYRFYDLSRSG